MFLEDLVHRFLNKADSIQAFLLGNGNAKAPATFPDRRIGHIIRFIIHLHRHRISPAGQHPLSQLNLGRLAALEEIDVIQPLRRRHLSLQLLGEKDIPGVIHHKGKTRNLPAVSCQPRLDGILRLLLYLLIGIHRRIAGVIHAIKQYHAENQQHKKAAGEQQHQQLIAYFPRKT